MRKLLYYPGSASMAPHILLEEIGAPFELVFVDRARDKTQGGGPSFAALTGAQAREAPQPEDAHSNIMAHNPMSALTPEADMVAAMPLQISFDTPPATVEVVSTVDAKRSV